MGKFPGFASCQGPIFSDCIGWLAERKLPSRHGHAIMRPHLCRSRQLLLALRGRHSVESILAGTCRVSHSISPHHATAPTAYRPSTTIFTLHHHYALDVQRHRSRNLALPSAGSTALLGMFGMPAAIASPDAAVLLQRGACSVKIQRRRVVVV